MEEYFHQVADLLDGLVAGGEVHLADFYAEASDFVRLNQNQVRQAGSVTMRTLAIDLISGRHHVAGRIALSGDLDVDRERIRELVATLRERHAHVPEDPYLRYATEPRSTVKRGENRLPEGAAAVGEIQRLASGADLVGIYAAGGIYAGFASSLGQRNWFESYSYNFDWSLYHAADKAVAESYAGFEWRSEELEAKMAAARSRLEMLARPPHTVPAGRYRAYLAPAALNEVLGLLAWGGFGLRAHRTKTTPLLRMIEEGAKLDPRITLVENTRDGFAPDFQQEGFLGPAEVRLIEAGAYRECLASPRTAAEYGEPNNGASASEMPQSLDLAAGEIPKDHVVPLLGEGIYVGNVWYANYSDRAACRITGLTRFATFWVEGGEIRSPLSVMRFDDTIYRMLGENLIGLTAERELILDPSTYGQRSTASSRIPGALLGELALTL
ncbi:MAG: metallopeptidase TldD-related protein [Candidatus Binatia bacterium]